MILRIRNIRFLHNEMYGSYVDVTASGVFHDPLIEVVDKDKWRGVVHFIFPNDDYFLNSVRTAYETKTEWNPIWEEFTESFMQPIPELKVIGGRDIPEGFIHKGFYLEPRAPFKFKIRHIKSVVDEVYSHIIYRRDCFNNLERIAQELCFVTASQYGSERLRPHSDIELPFAKTVRFLLPQRREILNTVYEAKQKNQLWEPNVENFIFDKFTHLKKDNGLLREFYFLPVLLHEELFPIPMF